MGSTFTKPVEHTKRFRELEAHDLFTDEVVLIAETSTEDRGQINLWSTLRDFHPERVITISNQSNEKIKAQRGNAQPKEILLRDSAAIKELISVQKLLIDISGLAHHIWAPILKAAYELNIPLRILYAEPDSYTQHSSPSSETVFDLSTSFDGLAPLPGFAQLSEPEDDEKCLFVAFLGFEGNRPKRLISDFDEQPKIIPIIGVPGFQLEFPSHTISCNRTLFNEFNAHDNIHLVKASCPFEAYSALVKIKADYPGYYMYLAPIGTKPHSLGVIWFAIINPDNTEIMFDHPVRKEGRTKGIGIIHIYNFGGFNGLPS